jgi:hypothetical protein
MSSSSFLQSPPEKRERFELKPSAEVIASKGADWVLRKNIQKY